MKRIKVIESNQGSGGTRVQEGAWQRLIQLENGYFEKSGNEYDFYTNDGLLIKAVKNSDEYMAKHFGAINNLLYVDYCEPGLGIGLINESTTTPNEFVYSSTGFYDAFGKSFFIKCVVSEEDENISVPEVWSYQTTEKSTGIENLRHFLFQSIFEPPLKGELLFKNDDETGNILLIYKRTYFRKLITQMSDTLKDSSYKGDRDFQFIYFSLKSTKLVKEYNDFTDFA